jgi:large subunit ribosomal protein L21
MLAVVKTGGKQYTVEVGTVIDVELLDAGEGDSHTFNDILLLSDGVNIRMGTPTVSGACVQAEVIGGASGPKILVFKRKRRKDYRKRIGHRQKYTRLKVTKIIG